MIIVLNGGEVVWVEFDNNVEYIVDRVKGFMIGNLFWFKYYWVV